jgi:DNA-binding HxlR family transcriptional regulator
MSSQTPFWSVVSDIFKVEILEERHAIRILLLLRKRGPMMRSAFYPLVAKGITTALIRVNMLIDEGLVEERILDKKPFSKTIQLSSKGRTVAENLASVEEVLTER